MSSRMTPRELRAGLSLALVFGLRLFGLFVILPVFAVYAEGLPGWNLALVGVAIGVYGLTQAILQIPFGWISDRLGRHEVMVAGLALMVIGSVVCALAQSPWVVIAGRIIQGAGAISGVAIATVADLTRDTQRAKAMALIGSTVTFSFALSFVLAPWLKASIGVPGIFALTAVLALAAVPLVVWGVPRPEHEPSAPKSPVSFRVVLADPALLQVNVGIFVLRGVLMALFVVLPPGLVAAGLDLSAHGVLYLVAVSVGFLLGAPAIFARRLSLADRPVVLGAVIVLAAGLAMAALGFRSLEALVAALVIFFAAFNVLEARLPAIMSRHAPPSAKGSASGVYASVQFLGTFCGAAAGGVIAETVGPVAVVQACLAAIAAWLFVAWPMPKGPARPAVPHNP